MKEYLKVKRHLYIFCYWGLLYYIIIHYITASVLLNKILWNIKGYYIQALCNLFITILT